ncbi:MAG TPA: NADH-quinone oxidoreductase subunit J [Thermodesulfobacteriota bacterium]|nr:NADH-quinone oxidoreductase subunit J [Thermodesulfobacteriota bacterium]
METVLFYIFAAGAVAGSMLVVFNRNPVGSILSLVLTLFSTAVLFVLLLAHFIAAIQVLVYAGAIVVLFLFTVMFLNLSESYLRFDAINIPGKLAVLVAVVAVLGYFASLGFEQSLSLDNVASSPENFGTVEGVGELLFNNYILPFELTSVLIVAAILGVVAIAKRKGE